MHIFRFHFFDRRRTMSAMMSSPIEQCIARLLLSNLENSTTARGSPFLLDLTLMPNPNVTAESSMLGRRALDEVVAVAHIFSDWTLVSPPI